MGTPLRYIPEEAKQWTSTAGEPIAVVEITIRTIQEMFLLKPTRRNKELVLGCIGRAREHYPFELYGYAFLPNHGSMIVGVQDCNHLARVMEHIHSNVAREIGRREHSDWPGRFWSRRGRAAIILTKEDLVARMRVLLARGTMEGMVSKPIRWPGAHCATALCSGQPDVGVWVDRTRLALIQRRADPGEEIEEMDAWDLYKISLNKLPCFSDKSDQAYQAIIVQMCREISVQGQKVREEKGRPPLGITAVLKRDPHFRPNVRSEPEKAIVHCQDDAARGWFLKRYDLFVCEYRDLRASRWRRLAGYPYPYSGWLPRQSVVN